MTAAHAATFRQLHHAPDVLLLPNAWDAGTARLVESLGARAIATTSAGVAWSHGYPDGDVLPLVLLVRTVAEIARVIRIPLTVDMEGGYAPDLVELDDGIRAVVDAGAVGINLEDGEGPPDLLCTKILRVKQAALLAGVDVYVNVRTDVYLSALGPPETRLQETLARARRYRDAGADGLFVPGLHLPEEIREVAQQIALPLNLLAWPGLPPTSALHALGVRRLSTGSGLTRAAYGRVAGLARSFLDGHPLDIPDEISHAALNRLVAR